MWRSCDVCGKRYEAKRRESRYCSPNCRKAGYRKGIAEPRDAVAGPPRPGPVRSLSAAPAQVDIDELVAAAERRLRDSGVLGTWQAQAALDLARQIVEGRDGGSARAALHREFRAAMGEALRGVDAPASRLGKHRDELQKRRDARARGA